MSARQLANHIHDWAYQNGYTVGVEAVPLTERTSIRAAVPEVAPTDTLAAEHLIERVEITGILVDEENEKVTVLTAGRLGPRNSKVLPVESGGVDIEWIGLAHAQQNPPPLPKQAASTLHCYVHGNRIACGSSISPATIFNAGTMGCLVMDQDGDLCGLTNNHVAGGCNHMQLGMPILSPAACDAKPAGPPPLAIGRHKSLIALQSGDPQAVRLQRFDAAAFKIEDANAVTSMQGPGNYDTPGTVGAPTGGRRVKKIGRTTELTSGTISGPFLKPIPIPYHSPNFNAVVYLTDVIGVKGDNGEPFCEGGDSGALVVSEDEQEAIGMIVGCMGQLAIVMPFGPLAATMRLRLVSGHNV